MIPVMPQVEQRVGNHSFAIETLKKTDGETSRGDTSYKYTVSKFCGELSCQRHRKMLFSEETGLHEEGGG